MMDGNRPERDPTEPAISAQQRAVLDALQSRDTDRFPLSRWYLGALYALRNRHNPDRLSQAAQSLRELMEKLPRVVQERDLHVISYDFRGKRQSLYTRIQKDKRRLADGWEGRLIDRPLARTLEEFEAYLKQSQRIGQVMKEAAVQAGIDPGRVHPHAFRHTYGRNCVLPGVPIPVLQKWLGHASMVDTQRYVELAGAHHE